MTEKTSPSALAKLLWWLPIGKVPEIEPSELAAILSDPKVCPQLLDVRTRREWSGGHLEGAVNIPISELRARLRELSFDRDRPVVTICRSAHRSIPAVRLLLGHGFEDVSQLAGGMKAWWRSEG